MITSAENLNAISSQVVEGEKIDYNARLLDAAKIAAVAASGGSAAGVASIVGTQVATGLVAEKTGLNKGSTGLVIRGATTFATGGDLTTIAQAAVEQKAQQEVNKMVVKESAKYIGGDFARAINVANKGMDIYAKGNELYAMDMNSAMAKLQVKAEEEVNQNIRESEARMNAEAQAKLDEKNRLIKELQQAQDEATKKTLGQRIEDLNNKALKAVDDERARLAKNLEQTRARMDNELARIEKDYENFDLSKETGEEWDRFIRKVENEKDRFTANWADKLWGLAKKYGTELLQYLMYRFGPQPDYDSLMMGVGEQQIQYEYEYYYENMPDAVFSDVNMGKKKFSSGYGLIIGGVLAAGILGYIGYKGMTDG